MKRRALFPLVVLIALLAASCAGDDDPSPTATTPPAATEAAPTSEPEPSPTSQPESTPTSEPEVEAATTEPEPTPTEEPAPSADLDALTIELVEVTSGLNAPVKVVAAYDGSDRLFILERQGTIRVVQDGDLQPDPFLDISDRVGADAPEQGLLGLAFHPDFPNTSVFYLNYTDVNGDTHVSRFTVDAETAAADPASEEQILFLEQPANNHNGGHLLFGPDGYLYIGTGDGGGGGDTFENAQNGETLLGAMLRINVDGGEPYTIPEDNHFVGDDTVRDEIWATGLRNPWRYAFDRETGDLYIADVGQNRIEEVSVQPAGSGGGENYGWPIMEGSECFEADQCDQTGLVLPVAEYTHDFGCSITGGDVYRGAEFPQLNGVYFYSDFCSGNIWGLIQVEGEWQSRLLLESGYSVTSFGEDEAGELYLVDMNTGVLYRMIAG